VDPGVSIGNLQSNTVLEPFVGLIDEVEVFNRALDPLEILAMPACHKILPRIIFGSLAGTGLMRAMISCLRQPYWSKLFNISVDPW